MHDDHSYEHDDHNHHHEHGHQPHGPGHNAHRPVQWQTPHNPQASPASGKEPEADFDLVETAFISAFATAPDPTSFLRLARIPFEGRTDEGKTLKLLRVETDEVVDVGSLSPHLGGTSMRYDPLPAKMVSRRRRLAFVYFDGQTACRLSFTEVQALAAHH